MWMVIQVGSRTTPGDLQGSVRGIFTGHFGDFGDLRPTRVLEPSTRWVDVV